MQIKSVILQLFSTYISTEHTGIHQGAYLSGFAKTWLKKFQVVLTIWHLSQMESG